MNPLTPDDLLPLDAWAGVRDRYREAIIEHKRARRIGVGGRVTLVFEDRETLRWQVQEMARVERIRDPALLQQELEVYNELVPGDGELSATLFVEITDLKEIRPELDRLVGIDEHVWLVIGAERIPARFDPKQMEEERISAVQYVRFSVDAEARAALADPAVPVSLRIEHPHYCQEGSLGTDSRQSLLRDLTGGVGPLVDVEQARPEPASDRTIESGRFLRVLAPAQPAAPGHLVLEALDPATDFFDAPPGLLEELTDAVRRHGAALVERHGSCRLHAELSGPLRWHLLGDEA